MREDVDQPTAAIRHGGIYRRQPTVSIGYLESVAMGRASSVAVRGLDVAAGNSWADAAYASSSIDWWESCGAVRSVPGRGARSPRPSGVRAALTTIASVARTATNRIDCPTRTRVENCKRLEESVMPRMRCKRGADRKLIFTAGFWSVRAAEVSRDDARVSATSTRTDTDERLHPCAG